MRLNILAKYGPESRDSQISRATWPEMAVSVVVDALKGMACLRGNIFHSKDKFIVFIWHFYLKKAQAECSSISDACSHKSQSWGEGGTEIESLAKWRFILFK